MKLKRIVHPPLKEVGEDPTIIEGKMDRPKIRTYFRSAGPSINRETWSAIQVRARKLRCGAEFPPSRNWPNGR